MMGDFGAALERLHEGRRRVFCCHRALFSARFSPNSRAAIRECVAEGAPRIEIDIRVLADGAGLVLHDAVVGDGPDAVSLAGLTREEAAAHVHERTGGAALFLEDVLDELAGSACVLQVDLKGLQPLAGAQARAVAHVLGSSRVRLLVGSQAHWNLRLLEPYGLALALDPSLHWHAFAERRAGDGLDPARLGLHGLWDDAPLAHVAGVAASDYIGARVADLLALVAVREWMVDVGTILHLRSLGCDLGEELRRSGVELTAWTVRDSGPEKTPKLLGELFAAGVTTVIADAPARIASYVDET